MAGPGPKDFDKEFGRAVGEACEACDPRLSQAALAEQAGLSLKTLGQIMRGERPARLSEAKSIADALAVPLDTLLGLGLEGMSVRDLRAQLAEIAREHAAMTECIAEVDEVIALQTRQANSYRATRAVMFTKWFSIRAELERRGVNVQHSETP